MNRLSYTDQPDRFETDPEVIANLVRKGWVDNGVHVDTKTSEQLEQERTILIKQAAQAEVNAAAGEGDLRALVNMLMRALKRVRRESLGQGNSSETAELSAMEAIADKVEAIRAEETRLLSDPNLTAADANWPA